MNQSPESPIEKFKRLAREGLSQSNPVDLFEQLYQEAEGDETQIPWAKLTPHPLLESWLNSVNFFPENKTALVIGCGLGDDAEFLASFGFKVVAFDISSTAISWCKNRFPNSSVDYQVADIFALPESWRNAFDFVVESRTIQALPLTWREMIIREISSLVKNQGELLIITHLRSEELPPDGPPWPLSIGELNEFEKRGFALLDHQLWIAPEKPDIQQIRRVYRCQK